MLTMKCTGTFMGCTVLHRGGLTSTTSLFLHFKVLQHGRDFVGQVIVSLMSLDTEKLPTSFYLTRLPEEIMTSISQREEREVRQQYSKVWASGLPRKP